MGSCFYVEAANRWGRWKLKSLVALNHYRIIHGILTTTYPSIHGDWGYVSWYSNHQWANVWCSKWLAPTKNGMIWSLGYPLVNIQKAMGKSSCLMGKFTISMAIFYSYVSLPEGIFPLNPIKPPLNHHFSTQCSGYIINCVDHLVPLCLAVSVSFLEWWATGASPVMMCLDDMWCM